MKRADKFTIIIPHYNTPKNLKILLDNLVEQKGKYYPETEIIVIDDGSDCDTSFLKSYGGMIKRIFQPNRGASNARNVGLMASTGKYIAFADADDNVTPNYLHTLYQTMRKEKCDYVLFPFIVASNKTIAKPRNERIGNYAVWSWAFTYDCIGNERFNENLNVAEDVDWLRRVITEDKKRFKSSEPIYIYDWNANPNSLSKRFNRGELKKTKEEENE